MRIQQVSEEGIFTKWQPQYAERRIATFPVKADKKPAIRRWNQITLKGSSRLAERFHESDAFGFQLGPKSQITALDVDSRDEAVLADALTCHGDTPFIVRTGGGYHAYYSYGGERRHIRPYHNKPIDILGGGFVVAPPSISERGTYQIIAGTLDDLTNLPPIQVALDNLRAEARIPEGRRNNTLFRFALEQARHSDTFDALLDVMRTRNMDCEPPLPDDVIISTAKSAWRYEQAGRNLVGRGRSVLTPHSVIDELIGEHQDAFVLLTLLQRHHWGRNFVLANAMADQLCWSRKRFAATRALLESRGFIQQVAPASFRSPAVYRLGAWGGRF
jgi:Bifunctional DNA primase/polymerase, N-terminal/Primase C terminal 1 (PriCT-1)